MATLYYGYASHPELKTSDEQVLERLLERLLALNLERYEEECG